MSTYATIANWLSRNEYNLDDYSLAAQGQIIYDYCIENGIQVAAFKDNRNSLFRLRGYKVRDALKAHRERVDGEIYMTYIDLGEVPLRSPDTVKLARRLEAEVIEPDAPRRAKLEHGVTRNSLIHVHFIHSGKEMPPKTVELDSKVYPVNTVVVGQVEKWKHYTYDEQLRRSVAYHYKPGNMAGTEGHKKEDLKYNAYLEWFYEQKELSKITPQQRQAPPRVTWNKNVKVKNDY